MNPRCSTSSAAHKPYASSHGASDLRGRHPPPSPVDQAVSEASWPSRAFHQSPAYRRHRHTVHKGQTAPKGQRWAWSARVYILQKPLAVVAYGQYRPARLYPSSQTTLALHRRPHWPPLYLGASAPSLWCIIDYYFCASRLSVYR
ncbi:uncharacterized protein SCHCODRAFT_02053479 [Schizophyllum commune H4-8]|uniref:uncharacterized protein n=1 Tax=Schizophyllum commune (strain H4-8 / FGSC 9210) TaxID=578458 RepID=UPI00215F4885|nr:uncharacterized protein SCHCODRAFT_02053479 [Schizophyllum commune H4-8]KAI5888391.1 hypothetical protein SCHCODRAFT_02053479 [Schizophyllum commune H4-8]